MNVETSLRIDMLDVVVAALTAVPVNQRKIEFLNVSGGVLGYVAYDHFESDTDVDPAGYAFLNISDSRLLSGEASDSGTVVSFRIISTTITGSAGSIGTGSDIEFNKIDWVDGDIIRINNLVIILPSGV